MEVKNNSVKGWDRKHSLISAIIGVSIAAFTFICCGLLIPLGLIGAAVFLHQYRIPLIILGVAIAGVSIFFMLKGKDIICVCKVFDLIKKYKKMTIISTGIIICIGLAIFGVTNFFPSSSRNFASTINPESTISGWRNNKAGTELVSIVNFLKGNIGKEIKLEGEKHLITGKEMMSIKVIMLECCTKGEFAEILDSISKIGKVKGSDFSKKEISAELPADEIPKIADIWNVEKISLEPDAKILWESIIKGF
ncbi:MAG: hypothetical protein ABIJ82_02775 [Patescibacteria group bacterium]